MDEEPADEAALASSALDWSCHGQARRIALHYRVVRHQCEGHDHHRHTQKKGQRVAPEPGSLTFGQQIRGPHVQERPSRCRDQRPEHSRRRISQHAVADDDGKRREKRDGRAVPDSRLS